MLVFFSKVVGCRHLCFPGNFCQNFLKCFSLKRVWSQLNFLEFCLFFRKGYISWRSLATKRVTDKIFNPLSDIPSVFCWGWRLKGYQSYQNQNSRTVSLSVIVVKYGICNFEYIDKLISISIVDFEQVFTYWVIDKIIKSTRPEMFRRTIIRKNVLTFPENMLAGSLFNRGFKLSR